MNFERLKILQKNEWIIGGWLKHEQAGKSNGKLDKQASKHEIFAKRLVLEKVSTVKLIQSGYNDKDNWLRIYDASNN